MSPVLDIIVRFNVFYVGSSSEEPTFDRLELGYELLTVYVIIRFLASDVTL